MNVSACLIIKNEEKNLERCLESLLPFAGEIIIVDTGSTDDSKRIASKFTDKIYDFAWNDNFSDARNFAIENATQDFILSIDADEYIENPNEIQKVLSNSPTDTGGWLVDVISSAYNTNGNIEKIRTSLLRLFLNHPQIRFQGICHEQVFESILALGLKIEKTDILLNHTGYLLNKDEFNNKQKRNIVLLEKALAKEPNNNYLLTHLGKTYSALKMPEKAKEIFKKVIDNSADNGIYKIDALNFYSTILFEEKKFRDSIKNAKQSLAMLANQAYPHFVIAEAYANLKMFDQAYYSYKDALANLETEDIASKILGQLQIPKENIYYKLGLTLSEMKIYDEAIKFFEMGLQINPTDFACLIGIANTAILIKDYGLATNFLNEIQKIYPNEPLVNDLLNKVQNKIGNLKQNVPTTNEESDTSQNQYIQEKKPLLTVSMIVKNEEGFIEGCLQSISGVADEIVIVDTGSTDKTIEIARKYTDKIFEIEWKDDFAYARNESLRHSTGEWILYLDADERLAISNKSAFINFLKNLPDDIGGIYCLIESNHRNFDGDSEIHRGGYPRLFRNLGYPNIYFRGRVHEQISPSILDQGKSFINSDIVIEHLGYNQSRAVMETKIKRNYKLLLQHVNEEPTNGYAWYQLGQTLAQMRLVKEAEDAVRMAIQCGNLSKSVLASATSTLAQIMGNKKNFSEALYWSEESLKNAPDQIFALHLKAFALLYLNRFDESLEAFQETLFRMKHKHGIPQTGFDIEIPEEIILKGLNKAQSRDSSFQ